MQSDDPPFLSVGTEVSAKFKGAFCEAKVKKLIRLVKCKVNLKESPFGVQQVDEKDVKGVVELNANVEIVQGKQLLRGVIQHIKDCSQYTVVFNDGDEKILRRTQLVLKSGKHFDSAVNLDALPLYNPEQFSTPVTNKSVKRKARKSSLDGRSSRRAKRKPDESEESDDDKEKKKKKRAAATAANANLAELEETEEDDEDAEDEEEEDEDEDEEEEVEEERKPVSRRSEEDSSEKPKRSRRDGTETPSKSRKEESVDREKKKEEKEEKKEKADKTRLHDRPHIGTVIVVFMEKNEKQEGHSAARGKAKWFPALTVSSKLYQGLGSAKTHKLKKTDIPFRSMQNGTYNHVPCLQACLFSAFDLKKQTQLSGDKPTSLVKAVERATVYQEKGKLPGGWYREQIFGDKKDKKEEEKEEKKEDKKEKKKEGKEEKEDKKKEKEKEKEKKKVEKQEKEKEKEKKQVKKESSSSSEESSDEDDEEQGEERDLFTAQFYKFHEERGTPINKAPILGGKDIDLHRCYKSVQAHGGYKKVTDNNKWRKVLLKMKLDGCPGATPITVKKAYQRYLLNFNSVYRNLGWSLDELSTSSISASRSSRRPVDYGFSKRRTMRKEKTGSKEAVKEREESTASLETAFIKREIKKEDESSIGGDDEEIRTHREASSSTIASHRSLSRALDSVSPMPPLGKEATKKKKKDGRISRANKEEDDDVASSTGSPPPILGPFEPEINASSVPGPSSGRASSSASSVTSSSIPGGSSSSYTSSFSGYVPDPNGEGYVAANVFSLFYQGQKVRALHHNKWYDARVVTAQQPPISNIIKAIESFHENDANPSVSSRFVDRMRSMSKEVRCLVHYLGWNARYDEYIPLGKMRISNKDDGNSLRAVKDCGRLSETTVVRLSEWARAPDGLRALGVPEPESGTIGSLHMGLYRPRRLSFTQYEQLSAEIMKGTPATTSYPRPPVKKIKEEVEEKEREKDKDSENRPRRIRVSGTSVGTARSVSVSPAKLVSPPSSPPLTTQPTPIQVKRELPVATVHTTAVFSAKNEFEDFAEITLPTRGSIRAQAQSNVKVEEKKPVNIPCQVTEDDDERLDREELALEDEASQLLVSLGYGSDAGQGSKSGSQTPATEDVEGDDVQSDVPSVSETPSKQNRQKRKKHHNQSNMVLDRRYAKKDKKSSGLDKSTEDDEEGEEEEKKEKIIVEDIPVVLHKPEATLHAIKQKMFKKMEADGTLYNFEFLGRPDLTKCFNLYGERVQVDPVMLDNHLDDLREYYQEVKSELMRLDRKNRNIQKKKLEAAHAAAASAQLKFGPPHNNRPPTSAHATPSRREEDEEQHPTPAGTPAP